MSVVRFKLQSEICNLKSEMNIVVLNGSVGLRDFRTNQGASGSKRDRIAFLFNKLTTFLRQGYGF
jgi:hypothetical protein